MRILAWGLLAALTLFAATPAQAALRLCNRTSYILYAATSSVVSPGSTTHGWTRIAPGDCQIALPEKLTAQTYLVYARSSLSHGGPQRAWGGNFPTCVKDGTFTLQQKVTQPYCAGSAMFAVPFAALDTHGRPDWTMRFDDQPALASLEAAQLAGVKRLLQDNGYKIAAIDGKPDKQTGAALKDFRAKMGFSAQEGNAELFAALEKQAGEKGQAPQGLTLCNDTKADVMAAIGEADGGVSRGWWRIGGTTCAHLVTAALTQNAIWLFAQHPGGGPLVTGTDNFCTAAPEFEIKGKNDCPARGFALTGFARIALKGPGVILHIGEKGLQPAMSK
jgi:uncharacterized membrane protein